MATRILIAGPQSHVRAQIARLIWSSGNDWEICADVPDGRAAVEKAAEYAPDLLILDLAMPHHDGLQAGRQIRAILPDSRMLLLSILPSDYLKQEAEKAGFFALVDKLNLHEIVTAICNAIASRPPARKPVEPTSGSPFQLS